MGWRGGFESGVNARGTGAVIENDEAQDPVGPRPHQEAAEVLQRAQEGDSLRDRLGPDIHGHGVVGPILTGYAIDEYIFPNGRVGNDVTGLSLIVVAYTAITVVMYIAEYIQTFYMATAGQHVIYRLRQDAVDKLEKLSLRYYNERPIGGDNFARHERRRGLQQLSHIPVDPAHLGVHLDRGHRHNHVLHQR